MYFDLYVELDRVDKHDSRIGYGEFEGMLPRLLRWGARTAHRRLRTRRRQPTPRRARRAPRRADAAPRRLCPRASA